MRKHYDFSKSKPTPYAQPLLNFRSRIKLQKNSPYILSTAIIALICFVAGTRFGAEIFARENAKYEALGATLWLQMLDLKEDKYIRASLNAEIDLSVYRYSKRVGRFGELLFPELQDDGASIKKVAHYRAENPVKKITQEDLKSLSKEEVQDILSYQAEVEKIINQHIEK